MSCVRGAMAVRHLMALSRAAAPPPVARTAEAWAGPVAGGATSAIHTTPAALARPRASKSRRKASPKVRVKVPGHRVGGGTRVDAAGLAMLRSVQDVLGASRPDARERDAAAAAAAAATRERRRRDEEALMDMDGSAWTHEAMSKWMWPLHGIPEVPEADQAQVSLAQTLFKGPATFVGTEFEQCDPDGGQPQRNELAFIGRSNVGKSTLINALVGSRRLAKVSNTPGCTHHLDFYQLPRDETTLVDVPGYGYAQRSKTLQEAWIEVISEYLRSRSGDVLRCTVVLVDARRGIADLDSEVMDMLDAVGVPYLVVLTKVDEVTKVELENVVGLAREELNPRGACFPVLSAASGGTGEGIAALKTALVMAGRLHTAIRE